MLQQFLESLLGNFRHSSLGAEKRGSRPSYDGSCIFVLNGSLRRVPTGKLVMVSLLTFGRTNDFLVIFISFFVRI